MYPYPAGTVLCTGMPEQIGDGQMAAATCGSPGLQIIYSNNFTLMFTFT